MSDTPTQSKSILVTGGAGAIGSTVVRRLSKNNLVVVVDNLSSGSRSNIADVPCELVVADIRDNEKVASIFNANSFDVVIHLAAHFANQNSVDFPTSDLSVNIQGTLNVLEQCRHKKPRLIYASSSCVYGKRSGPMKEDLPIDDLHTPYAISKYSAEKYCEFYANHYGFEAISLRFFNSYGPYDPPGPYRNVIPNFIVKALNGDELCITGTGEETRDFNYCQNTVDAVCRTADHIFSDQYLYRVFNVGTGHETKIIDLAQRIVWLTGDKSKITICGKRRDWDKTMNRCADISKITTELNYVPRITLDEGLPKTIEWIKDNWSQVTNRFGIKTAA
ncbi:MAG: NAD-dependent epimerase/dehydratase family protein [Pirellulales bacterium]